MRRAQLYHNVRCTTRWRRNTTEKTKEGDGLGEQVPVARRLIDDDDDASSGSGEGFYRAVGAVADVAPWWKQQ